MKRSTYSLIIIVVLCVFAFASCKKQYNCQCSYNNQIRMVKDLGLQVKSDAEEICTGYDTTVTGEKWTCVLN